MKQFQKLLKYVSEINILLGHPYFVNIGLPSNYRYFETSYTYAKVDEDFINVDFSTEYRPGDITYASFKVGMYLPKYDKETWVKIKF